MPSIYALKPAFQGLLRPLVAALARAGVRANHVTLLAAAPSVGLGCLLAAKTDSRGLLLLLPGFLFVRMAMNAIDGMLAREFDQKSDFGAYLNELSDVVSDAFLYLPFAWLSPFEPLWIGAVIWLAAISEMTGVLGVMIGASRRYDGPMGKSDRAFVFGLLALWMGFGGDIAPSVAWLFSRLMALLLAVTMINRVRNGLAEKKAGYAPSRRAVFHDK